MATSERLDVPACGPRSKEEHEHHERYLWAASRVTGDVLDIACGSGHGSAVLARAAAVTGIDRDAASVRFASTRSEGSFVVAEVPPIPAPGRSFDAVVCFETIEHIGDDAGFVAELRRVLRPAGRLLISSPNAEVSAPAGAVTNPWHVREYSLESLAELLRASGFEPEEVWCQWRPARESVVRRTAWRLRRLPGMAGALDRRAPALLYGSLRVRQWGASDPPPGYWIVVAA